MRNILDKINTPADLKTLSRAELLRLPDEIREQMLVRLSATGGHVGSNLAVIEATIALHTVFNSTIDKIVFDVSHQCYTHKFLTGRKEAYTDPAKYGAVSGFTNPNESKHDIFSIGHTSTAISLACGLAKARDLENGNYNVIAVVGDGALSGGEALEGLNNASATSGNLIIAVNDNDMSIAENHGGIYQNLKLLRDTDGTAECNLFRAMGLDYRFVRDGHDLEQLLAAFEAVKDTDHPTVVHICTIKGKGYPSAEECRESWHYMGPFDRKTGAPLYVSDNLETYENLTRDFLKDKMSEDPTITAITAGTPKIFGFDEALRKRFSKQSIDVGIAEEHAVALVSGIAKNGGKPVFGASSTFLQRTYDQLSHDLALNRSPAVILVFFAGISQGSQTHMGISDISMMRSIPNLVCLAPTCKEEYLHMLDWALEQKEHPVVIRVPGIGTVSRDAELLPEGDEVVVVDDSSILIAYFSWSGNTKQLAEEIQTQAGGELFEIIPEPPYTENINELSGISLQEQRNDIRPPLSTQVDDMDQYDVVFIGFPNWWNNAPMPVFTFLEQYDFSGKTVVPFTSYGTSGWGNSLASIQRSFGNHVTMVEGLAVQEENMQNLSTRVTTWLQGLGFAK